MAEVDAVECAQSRHGTQTGRFTVILTMYLHGYIRYWHNNQHAYAGIVAR